MSWFKNNNPPKFVSHECRMQYSYSNSNVTYFRIMLTTVNNGRGWQPFLCWGPTTGASAENVSRPITGISRMILRKNKGFFFWTSRFQMLQDMSVHFFAQIFRRIDCVRRTNNYNLTPKIEDTLRSSNYDAKPWYLHIPARKSQSPRCFWEIDRPCSSARVFNVPMPSIFRVCVFCWKYPLRPQYPAKYNIQISGEETKKQKQNIRKTLGRGILNTRVCKFWVYLSRTACQLDSEGVWVFMLEPACALYRTQIYRCVSAICS